MLGGPKVFGAASVSCARLSALILVALTLALMRKRDVL